MKATEVKELVRNWYGSVAAGSAGCCGSNTAPGMHRAMRGTSAKRRITSCGVPGTRNSPSKCIRQAAGRKSGAWLSRPKCTLA